MAKKKKRKYKLKSSFKRFLIYSLVFIIIGIYGIINLVQIKKEYDYHQTNEYKIIQKGYTLEQSQKILSILNESQINDILNNEFDDELYDIITQKYFLNKNYDKYLEYKEFHENTPPEKVIAIVNVHANSGWYNITFPTDTEQNDLILVNKFYYLTNEYTRDDLTNVSLSYAYNGNKIAEKVLEAFLEMHSAIKEDMSIHLMINSSYRPYEDQESIYKEFQKVSQKYADSYAARPGFSEHQTGLAIDITSTKHPSATAFKESEEYTWLKDNSYKYGFILRYPEDKEDITGYNTESWHFRYVGKEIATKIFEENITFDEYYAFYIEGNKEIEQ